MSVEVDLVDRLTAHVGLSALIGDRLDPGALPQSPTLPAVTYSRISTPRIFSHSGYSGIQYPRFQLDVWAATHVAMLEVAEQLLLALLSLREMGIRVAFPVNEQDLSEPLTGRYRRVIDAVIWYEE